MNTVSRKIFVSKKARSGSQQRTCSAAAVKAYWEADISTAMDVVIRLSDNDRYDHHKFIREVIRKLKPWGEPPNVEVSEAADKKR